MYGSTPASRQSSSSSAAAAAAHPTRRRSSTEGKQEAASVETPAHDAGRSAFSAPFNPSRSRAYPSELTHAAATMQASTFSAAQVPTSAATMTHPYTPSGPSRKRERETEDSTLDERCAWSSRGSFLTSSSSSSSSSSTSSRHEAVAGRATDAPLQSLILAGPTTLGIIASFMEKDDVYETLLTLLALTRQPHRTTSDQAQWAVLQFLTCGVEEMPTAQIRTLALTTALSHHGDALHSIPDEVITPHLLDTALKSENRNLVLTVTADGKFDRSGRGDEASPEALQSRERCLFEVQRDGLKLVRVPERHRDRQMCAAAVAQNGNALYWVPEALRTREMCLLAETQNSRAFAHFPDRFKPYDRCLSEVTADGHMLSHVPERHRDLRMCEAALAQQVHALRWVPDDLLTPEMCQRAVKQEGNVLADVPDRFKTYALCLSAVRNGATSALAAVPARWMTKTMCRIAVRANPYAFEAVPETLRDAAMWRRAVKENGQFLAEVPPARRDRSLCLNAVRTCGEAIHDVPAHLIDAEILSTALTLHDFEYLPDDIPDTAWNADVATLLMEHMPENIASLPERLRTRQIYLLAVRHDVENFARVPAHMLDLEMCLAGLRHGKEVLQYVPENLREEIITRLASYKSGDYLGLTLS